MIRRHYYLVEEPLNFLVWERRNILGFLSTADKRRIYDFYAVYSGLPLLCTWGFYD